MGCIGWVGQGERVAGGDRHEGACVKDGQPAHQQRCYRRCNLM